MTDDGRSPSSALKGRLADIYVPALVSGAIDALSRRLGNRATIDDPLCGRASSLVSIDPLLERVAAYFASGNATYEHVSSTTGIDRDAAEGRITMIIGGTVRHVPIAVVAERRRLREIELRVYYAAEGATEGRKGRVALVSRSPQIPLATPLDEIMQAVRDRAIHEALGGFEETATIIDPSGRSHAKLGGAMSAFLADLGDVDVSGTADDGRSACVEVALSRRGHDPIPALFAFERGASGLVSELRVYWD